MYSVIADGIFVTHLIFIVLAFPSVALALAGVYNSRPMLWAVHNLSMAIMVAGRLSLGECPLVSLEEGLRTTAGQDMPYYGSFVVYIVDQATGWHMPNEYVTPMAAAVVLLTLVAIAWHARPSFGQSTKPTSPASEAQAA